MKKEVVKFDIRNINFIFAKIIEMEEKDIRETLTLVSAILSGLHCNVPAKLISDFLAFPENEEDYLSHEELNEKLDEYLKVHMVTDVDLGCRMIRLGDLYLPLNSIVKWRRDSKYSYKNHRQEYRILINENEGKSNKFDNMVAVYDTEEACQKDIEKLLEMKLTWGQL